MVTPAGSAPAPRRGERGSRGPSRLSRGAWRALALFAVPALGLWSPGVAAAARPEPGSVVLAFVPVGERELQSIPGMSAAIVSVSRGYSAARLLHDASRGLRPDERSRLLVLSLPGGTDGRARLRALSAARRSGELLIAVQSLAPTTKGRLLWVGVAGLPRGAGKTLSSQTTNERGLVAAIDLAPTILAHLGRPPPAALHGRPLHTDGALDGPYLRRLMARLHVVGPRRLPALGWLLAAWALLLLLCAPSPRARAWAMRAGALGVLWAPVAVLIPAALHPGAAVEYLTIALACLTLGALTDLLLPWPRAPLVPAAASVIALAADALAGTQLLVRSVLGPNPLLGVRFYGIGNELKSGLAVLVLAAVAGALYPATRGRRPALAMAGAGVLLAIVEGSARIGAGVGGVILVSAGTAVASVMLLGGALTRRRALTVLIAPVLGLAALAALDLATAHGSGHYTGTVLHARSPGDLRDVLVRRYSAAFGELHNHAMPVATFLALLSAVVGVRRRERLLAPVNGDPAWQAALAGGLTAGVVGALVEDSGPVLLVVAVFTLICVLAYLWGRPVPAPAPTTPRSPHRSRAARSRARTRPAAPAR